MVAIGDRVALTPLGRAAWDDKPWGMRPRPGTVIVLGWSAEQSGSGQVAVRWDALRGDGAGERWCCWVSTDMLTSCAEGSS